MLNINFTPFPILTTERLTLRQLTTADQQEIFTLRSDHEINKYLDRQASKTIDEAGDFIHKVNENIDKNAALYWAITLTGKNMLIGTICLFSFSEKDNTCEIGYELLPNFQGKGIMKEAVEKVIDYAFDTIKVQKIAASLHKDNRSSVKLLEKCGFIKSDKPDEVNPALICYDMANTNI